MSIVNQYPTKIATLGANFAKTKKIPAEGSFSRPSVGTYMGADGLIKLAGVNEARFDHKPLTGESLGLLVEESRTNRVNDSEQFYNNTWGRFKLNVVANTTVAPNGTLTGSLIYPTETSAFTYVQRGWTLTGYATMSVYAKSAGKNFLALWRPDFVSGNAWFNLSAGTVSSVSLGTASIVPVGNGWYRCTYVSTVQVVNNSMVISVADADNSLAVTASGTNGIYIWGAQAESSPSAGSFPTTYFPTPPTFTGRASIATFYNSAGVIQTAASGVARSNVFLPDSNGVFRSVGLLLEEARTNSLPYSQGFTTGWHTARAQVVTGQPDPAGGTNAILVKQTNGTSTRQYISSLNSTYIASNFTVSVFVKYVNYDYVILSGADEDSGSTGDRFGYLLPKLRFQFSTKTILLTESTWPGTSSTINYGFQEFSNGWYRLWITRNTAVRNNYWGIALQSNPFVGISDLDFVTGDNSSSVLAFGFQVEAGSFPTSYIPTVASQGTRNADASTFPTVTRAADNLSIPTSRFINSSGGTFVVESEGSLNNRSLFSLNNGTTSNELGVLIYPNSGGVRLQTASFAIGLVLYLDAGNPASYPGTGTTWTDLSGNSNTGTLTNGPTYSSANGGSIVFDGANVYVSNTMPNPGSVPITFDFWINSNTSTPVGLFDTAPGNGNVLRNFGAGNIEWWNSDPTVSLGVSALTWTNITIEYSFTTNRTIKYYRNGNLITTATGGAAPTFAWTSLIFGNINGGSSGWYSGKISTIKIYNRALTATEISQNFNALRGRYSI